MNTATVQWITTVYLLVVAATMPLSSFLNRRFRLKSLFIAAVVLAVTGSAIVIVGHTFPVILLARVIQGIGSGVATPLMMNIILEQSPRSKVGCLMGVGSLVTVASPSAPPSAAQCRVFCRGVPSSSSPSRSCCWSPCRWTALHRQKRPTEDARLNPVQFVAIVLALSGMILALNQMGVAVSAAVNGSSATRPVIITVVSLVVGVGSLVFFGWSSSRSFSPLIRLGWLRDRVVQLHLLAYPDSADRRHRIRIRHHQSGPDVAWHQRVPRRRPRAAGRSGRCVLLRPSEACCTTNSARRSRFFR